MIQLYTIYEKTANKWSPVMASPNDEIAKRNFAMAIKDTIFLEDFELVQIGNFDDENGKLKSNSNKHIIYGNEVQDIINRLNPPSPKSLEKIQTEE